MLLHVLVWAVVAAFAAGAANVEALNPVSSEFCSSVFTWAIATTYNNLCEKRGDAFGGGYLNYVSADSNTVTFKVCEGTPTCDTGCLSPTVTVNTGTCYQSSSNPQLFYNFFYNDLWMKTFQSLYCTATSANCPTGLACIDNICSETLTIVDNNYCSTNNQVWEGFTDTCFEDLPTGPTGGRAFGGFYMNYVSATSTQVTLKLCEGCSSGDGASCVGKIYTPYTGTCYRATSNRGYYYFSNPPGFGGQWVRATKSTYTPPTSCPANNFLDNVVYNTVSGATSASCVPCATGLTAPAGSTSSSACLPPFSCLANFYNLDAGTTSAACQPCDTGLTSPPGSKSVTDCTAPPTSTQPFPCLANFYNLNAGTTDAACIPCASGTTSPPNSKSASDCVTPATGGGFSSSASSSSSSSSGSNLGAIIGGVVGGIVAIIVLIVVVIVCCCGGFAVACASLARSKAPAPAPDQRIIVVPAAAGGPGGMVPVVAGAVTVTV